MKRFYIKQSHNAAAEKFLKSREKTRIELNKIKPNTILNFKTGCFAQLMPIETKNGVFEYTVAKKYWGSRMK